MGDRPADRAVFADLQTALPVRQRPTREAETFAAAEDVERVDVEMTTEDIAHLLFRLEGGCVGAAVVSQVSAGRKNSLRLELDGSEGALTWDAERNEELWLGHRDRTERGAAPQPRTARGGGAGADDAAGRPCEGYAETFRELYRAVYSAVAEAGCRRSRIFRHSPTGTAQTCSAMQSRSRTTNSDGWRWPGEADASTREGVRGGNGVSSTGAKRSDDGWR